MPKSNSRRKNPKAQTKKANREKNQQHDLKGPMARLARELREKRQQTRTPQEINRFFGHVTPPKDLPPA